MPRHDSSCESSRVESLLADIIIMQWICFLFGTRPPNTKAAAAAAAAKWKRCHKSKRSTAAAPATGWNGRECCCLCLCCCCDSQSIAGGWWKGGGGWMVGKALSLSLSLANHKSVKYDLPLACAASAWTCTRALALGWIAAAVAADADSVHEMSASSKPAQSAMRSPVAAIFDCLRSCQRLDSGCQRLLDVARGWQLLPEVANDCLLLPTFAKGC